MSTRQRDQRDKIAKKQVCWNYLHGIGIIHATTVVECSLHPQLKQEDTESFQKFLLSEDHLEKNIVKMNMKFETVSSKGFRNNRFTHTVSLELHVFLSCLWESPLSYIAKQVMGHWSPWPEFVDHRISIALPLLALVERRFKLTIIILCYTIYYIYVCKIKHEW